MKAPPSTHERFARMVHDARTDRNWSIYETAQRADARKERRWHTTTIIRIERAEGRVSLEQAVELAELLDLDLVALTRPPRTVRPIENSAELLAELDDLIAGVEYVEVVDPVTGVREDVRRFVPEHAVLSELPEIPEEDR